MDTNIFIHKMPVLFADTDMAGIVHFSNFYRYFEASEHALLQHLEIPLINVQGMKGWPRVHASCSFCAPFRYPDQIQIHTHITSIGNSSLTLNHKIINQNGIVAADAEATIVYAQMGTDQDLSTISIPKEWRRKFERYYIEPKN